MKKIHKKSILNMRGIVNFEIVDSGECFVGILKEIVIEIIALFLQFLTLIPF